ncbi:thiamine phosphate synthase [Flavobacterium sp.]|uniref:thiamine phosphate synthase n=1 Tax=Flavobacterium sp. TaxID=239 RepID=UPI00261B02F3|nr:thiamine phosphate synthase [Flavobacterium sp.]
MIIISNPIAVENEINIIHSLFIEGLKLLHVRKPNFSETEMKAFLSEIRMEFRNRLVLHQHHHLSDEFNIERLHFSEKNRAGSYLFPKKTISTSTHSITDFNMLDSVFEYAFLSPVFSSISKKGYSSKLDFSIEIEKRTNHKTKLIALGGIQAENINQAISFGFDDVALLGAIWESTNPLENFKKCQQTDLSYSL